MINEYTRIKIYVITQKIPRVRLMKALITVANSHASQIIWNISEIISHKIQIIGSIINIQNRLFFQRIKHKTYKLQNGIIASRRLLHAFLNNIHIQIVVNNSITK